MKHIIFLLFTFLIAKSFHAQCVDNGNYWNKSWVSCSPSANPNSLRGNSLWLLYEFQEHQYIDSTHIWNANRNGHSILGAKDVAIDYSLDGTNWLELGYYTFPKASETNTYAGFAGPIFNGVFLKKILITILSDYNGQGCASIAEVQFKVDQSKCYGEIDKCGVCKGNGKTTWYKDADGDGLGNPEIFISACTQPSGYVNNNNDNNCDHNLIWDDIFNVFQNSGCTGCHGNNGFSGLDLRSYNSFIIGGNKCGTGIQTGSTLVDIITTDGYNGCDQTIGNSMNSRVGNKAISNEQLAEIQAWVDAGIPENCIKNCSSLTLEIQFDAFPNQTSWDIVDDFGNVVISKIPYGSFYNNADTTENICIPNGCYTLNFYDTEGNGMCPFTNMESVDGTCITNGVLTAPGKLATINENGGGIGFCGNFALKDKLGNILADAGGDFGSSISYDFCIGNVARPTTFTNIESPNVLNDKGLNQLNIIPNLVLDNATLSYSLQTTEDIHIQIVDVTGKLIQQYTRSAGEISQILMDVTNYNAGFYFVRLVSGPTTLTDKFFKL